MNYSIYISLAGSDANNGDYSLLKNLAATDGKTTWSSLKGVKVGEKVLIYCQRPHSAVVATAEAASVAKPGKRWPYEVEICNVQLVERPITRTEIAKQFPEWRWAKTTRGGTRPPVDVAEWLWGRARTNLSDPEIEVVFKAGAGFGDPVNNRKVETSAVNFVISQLKIEGYAVLSRESEKIGYDLEAKKPSSTLHVEVKGVSGDCLHFPITANEVRYGKLDPKFQLFVVTRATSKAPILHRYTWADVTERFKLNPIVYMAELGSTE
jgi:hypothetical protein